MPHYKMDYMAFSWILKKKTEKNNWIRIYPLQQGKKSFHGAEYGSTHYNRVKKAFTGLPALLTSFARPTWGTAHISIISSAHQSMQWAKRPPRRENLRRHDI